MKRDETMKCAAWIWGLSAGYRFRFALTLIIQVSLSVILALVALLSKELVDAAVDGRWDVLIRSGAVLLVLIIIRICFSTLNRALCNMTSERMQLSLHRRLISHMLRVDETAASAYHSGVLMNRLLDDVSATAGSVFNLPVSLIAALADLACGTLVFLLLDAWLMAIIFAAGLILFLGSRLMRSAIQKRYEAMRQASESIHAKFQEMLENRVVVKTFNGHERVAAWLRVLSEGFFLKWRKSYYMFLCTRTVSSSFFDLGYFIVLLVCAYRLYQHEITFGEMTTLLQLINQMMTPFTNISGLLPALYTSLSSAKRLMELEALPAEQVGDALKPADCVLNALEADHLRFAYDSREILSDVSFSIPVGAFVLISGESGVGKSTLVKLLLGLYPSENLWLNTGSGRIAVGCDTRGMFAYVPQGNMLMSGTLRENLTFFTGEKSDEELYEALRICHADGFVRDELEHGLDTAIGEKAVGLSEGQAQRIAVARALLSDAPILLLDEATSALDPETEAILLQNIKALPGKTILFVSHKPAARAVSDWELCFDKNGVTLIRQGGTQSV